MAPTEPATPGHTDAQLLIDALDRREATDLAALESPVRVNLDSMLSAVQRHASALRQAASAVLPDRLHHDRPIYGRYGSVRGTTRRTRY